MSQVRREEIHSSRQAMLADESDKLRARKRRICNVIHHSTWVAESSTLLACAIFQILTHIILDSYLVNCISDTLFNLIVGRIIAPFAHLFNEQRIKIIVLHNGWLFAMKHALKFDVVRDESQPDHAPRQSQKNVAAKEKIRVKISEPARRVHPSNDRVEVFSIKINKGIEERQKAKFLEEITIPSHLNEDIDILPNAVPSW